MRFLPVLLALMLAASPAGAVWGPSFGAQMLNPEEGPRWTGWEAGLAAFGPEGQGFWHFAYGEARDGATDTTLSTIAGRLNFRLVGQSSYHVYGGVRFGRDELSGGVTKKAWTWGVQAGILLCPIRLGEANPRSHRAPTKGPATAKSFDIGIEGGYRMGPEVFKGPDARVFILLTL